MARDLMRVPVQDGISSLTCGNVPHMVLVRIFYRGDKKADLRTEACEMAKIVEAYKDDRGTLHNTPAGAVIADIAAALGRVGEEGGLTNGVAVLILEKRKEIERAFADLDMLLQRQESRGEVVQHPAKRSDTAA
jgi:hypothetical protein